VRLDGELRLEAIVGAFEALIDRQESLRTRLTRLGDTPEQAILPRMDVPISYVDLMNTPASRREALVSHLVSAERASAFELLEGPLWRCLIVGVSRNDHIMALHFCHLVMDGVSLMSFFDQFWRLYVGEAVEAPRRQFREVVPRTLGSGAGKEARIRRRMEKLLPLRPRAPYPTDYRASPPSLVSTASSRFENPMGRVRIRAICRASGVTPFMLYLAAYAMVIARTSGSDRVVFGTSLARLDLKPDEALLGYFLDPILIPIRVEPKATLEKLLAQVREEVFTAQEDPVPYLELAAALNPDFHSMRPWPAANLYDAWVRGRVFETVSEGPDSWTASFGGSVVTLYAPGRDHDHGHVAPADHRPASHSYLPSLYLDDADGAFGHLAYNRCVFTTDSIETLSRRLLAAVEAMEDLDRLVDVAWHHITRSAMAAAPAHQT
jgi:hypothetical protein